MGQKWTDLKMNLIAAIALLSLLIASQARALTLNEYMDQVQGKSAGYKASQEQAQGSALRSREADLIFTPQLFAEATVGHDGKPASPPAFIYDRLNSEVYSLGISQQFDFGLQSKLYYSLNKTDFQGGNFGPGILTSYWDASPKIELSLPIWGGGFGSTARANEQLLREQNNADKFNSQAQALGFLAQAEAAYWKLSAQQEIVRVQDTALTAAQNILNYLSKKQKMNLGEDADVVQARALVESRSLELQMAKNDSQEALRAVNRYLNRDAETPVETVEAVNYETLESIAIPKNRPGDRYDVKATEAQVVLAKANSAVVTERNRPTLDIYGNYSLNGRDAKMNEALKNAGYSERDTTFVGMRFSMPLNILATGDAKAGALKTEKAAEYNRQYALYSQEQDWINLTKQLGDAGGNMRLMKRIEAAQKEKLEVERRRLRQGRTTTYQVLMFEQDYSQAALSRAKLAANILALQTQVKLYQASNSEGGK